MRPAEIDRHLWPHRPIGVFQGLLRRRLGNGFGRPCAKRSAGSGQRHDFDCVEFGIPQSLKNRVMFAVDGKNPRSHGRGLANKRGARTNETFLVGESDRAPRRKRCIGRLDAGGAGNRAHNDVGGRKAASMTA